MSSVGLNLFFDIRRAPNGTSHAEQVATILDMCEWADALEGVTSSVGLPEHHGFDDGYLPSPVVLGSAIAGRTHSMRVQLVLIAPFYDPVRLAEDLALLDLVSRGRLNVTLVAGYVGSEFATFGVDPKDRGRKVEDAVEILKKAWTGERFAHGARQIRVTPRPYQDPRPQLILGGSSRAAARRAVRVGDGFWPTANPELWQIYRDELRAAGRDPGPEPADAEPFRTLVAVSDDPDLAWETIGPFCMHETNSYHRVQVEEWGDRLVAAFGDPPAYPHVERWQDLRESGRYIILTPEECLEWARDHNNTITIQPLTSGIDPGLAWESLRKIEYGVLPELRRP